MSLLENEKNAEDRQRTIRNERVKLSATYLNGVAIATFAIGALTIPLSSVVAGTPSMFVVVIAAICTCASAGLHSLSRFLLRGLR